MTLNAIPRFGITDFGISFPDSTTPPVRKQSKSETNLKRRWERSKPLLEAKKQLPSYLSTDLVFLQPNNQGDQPQVKMQIIRGQAEVAEKVFPLSGGVHVATQWLRSIARSEKSNSVAKEFDINSQEKPWYKSKKLDAALKQLPNDHYTHLAFVQPSKAGERIRTRVEILQKNKGLVTQKTFPQWKGIHAAAHWVRTMAKQLKRQDKA